MTKQELMNALVDADGAILFWQMPREAVEEAVASGEAYIADDDCLVHRDAVSLGDGAYTMHGRGA